MGVPGAGPNPSGQYPSRWEYGVVHVFRHTGTGPLGGWAEEATLQQANRADLDATGTALAFAPLGSGRLALAARSRTDVLLFERDPAGTWAETARLPVGQSARLTDPNVLAAAASTAGALVVSTGAGGARVFRRGPAGWAQQAVLAPAVPGTGFSAGVAVIGAGEARRGLPLADDLALVGANVSGNVPGGAAYVFRYDAAAGVWAEEAVLRPSAPAVGFGRVGALDVDAAGRALALVLSAGPPGAPPTAVVNVFRREATGVWTETAVVDLPTYGAFGAVWGAWGGRAVTSSSAYASNGTNSGGAWVVDLRPVLPVAGEDGPAGTSFALSAPAPNPVRGAARVTVSLPEAGVLDVRLFNVLGQEVARVADGEHAAGAHTLAVETSGLAPGVYLLRATAGTRAETRRMTVVR